MSNSLKSKYKELLNHGLIYGLTSSLHSLVGFVLLPILTVYYTTSDFGVYSIILLASALASAIFYLGASSSLARFYYESSDELYKKKIVSSALFVTAVGALILIILSFIFGKQISVFLFDSSDYYLHIILAFSGAAFKFLLNTMTLWLRYERQSKLFLIVTIIGSILNFLITYILLTIYGYGILAPLIGSLSSFSLIFLILLFIKFPYLILNFSYSKKILSFGIQAAISGFLFYLLDYLDRLILNSLVGLSDVGIYSLGARIAVVINIIFIIPFSLIWAPMRMQYANSSDNKEFTYKISSYFSIIGFLLILTSILFGEEIILLFFKNAEYIGAVKIFPIIMLALLMLGFQNIVDIGIYLHKKMHFYIIISIIGISFNVIMNYWLIPYFGYIASAYITFLTYLLTSTLFYIISSHYTKMNLEFIRVFTPIIILILIYYLSNYTEIFLYQSFLKRIFIYCILILFVYLFWLKKEERISIKQFLRN
ncbi:oligosaccharide flippase family protein [Flavobacteriaceae bacterium]|nr:oligosaccharide flippase family protein [Flavobacteriaceae bacterium]